MKTFITITLAFVLFQSSSVNSLQCYECTGPLNVNSDCQNLNHIPPTTCTNPNHVCAGYILKNPETEILHRTCASDDICALLVAQYENDPSINVSLCQVCAQEECNSAGRTVSIVALSFLSLCVSYLLL